MSGSLRGVLVTITVTREFLREGEWLQGQPDRIQADADKHQAVCDRVLRDGQTKSVAEVRELLEHDWRVSDVDREHVDVAERAGMASRLGN